MMKRRRFLGALVALIGAGTVNPKLFDSNDDSDGLYPFQREGLKHIPPRITFDNDFNTGFYRTGKVYAPYVPLHITSLV